MGKRRTLDRRALRDNFEAAEARERDQSAPGEEEGAEHEEADVEAEESGEEPKPAPKKKVAKEPKPKRTRTAKQAPQKVVWVVFDNSNKQVGDPFPYPRKH